MSTPQAKSKTLAENVAEFKVAQAVNHQKKGEYAQAKQLLDEVLATLPRYADALHLLGILAQQTGNSSEALELLSQSVTAAPANPIFHQNLGNLQAQLGDLPSAARSYQRSLELDPGNAQCWIQLGDLLGQKADYLHAEQCYVNALKLDMSDDDNWMRLALCLRHQDRLDEAISVYLDRLKQNPTNVRLLIETGVALTKHGNLSQSAKVLNEASRLDPSSAEAQYNLGVVFAEQGDFEGARQAYASALLLDPASTQPYPSLAAITRFKGGEPLISEMEGRLKGGAASDINLHFSLGKAHDDAGDYDASFEHYLKGNALARRHISYSTESQWGFCRNVMRHFDRDTVTELAQAGLDSDVPLFIVGMPRSGTSLVEQILASHPQVYGAGELTLLQRELMSTLGASSLKDLVHMDISQFTAMPAEQRQAVAAKTLSAMRRLAPDASRITDKMPQNFLLLGLLHAFFPAAKIVHCRRDPLDTCVSCFTVLFGDGQEFAYDLAELGEYYSMYAALMKHWELVLPTSSLLTVDYEEVVTDIRKTAERLLRHCELPWDEACVSFHENKRPVQTASVYQVRQPLYKSSVGRWQRFSKYLDPLRKALEKNGVALANRQSLS
ncbi:MAG TPA: sulfotransferase [Gammaproteobacteria bacterium]|jgi:tetratricopeptide (TPR) repeat protein|nr:sulfotransferase [Gammaproteobacteria bacterium]